MTTGRFHDRRPIALPTDEGWLLSIRSSCRRTVPAIQTALVFVIGGGIVALAGLFIEELLLRYGFSRFQMVVASNAILGTTAGLLFAQIRLRQQEKREVLKDRLDKVADMNHHVRNALTVVVYSMKIGNADSSMLQGAVERIEWALREVLPRGWGLDNQVPEKLIAKARMARSGARNHQQVRSSTIGLQESTLTPTPNSGRMTKT